MLNIIFIISLIAVAILAIYFRDKIFKFLKSYWKKIAVVLLGGALIGGGLIINDGNGPPPLPPDIPGTQYEDYDYWMNFTFANSGGNILVDFPVLIHLNSATFTFAHAESDGSDIVFYDDDFSTVLDHEIELWDGTDAYIWVNVPQIDKSDTDFITMFYGIDTPVDYEDIDGTWNDNFVRVLHLDEDISGYDLHQDSKFEQASGYPVFTGSGDAGTSAKIGSGDYFDGTGDYVSVNNDHPDYFFEYFMNSTTDQGHAHVTTVAYYDDKYWVSWSANNDTNAPGPCNLEGLPGQYITVASGDDMSTPDDMFNITNPYDGDWEGNHPYFWVNPYDDKLWLWHTWFNQDAYDEDEDGGRGVVLLRKYDGDSWSSDEIWEENVTLTGKSGTWFVSIWDTPFLIDNDGSDRLILFSEYSNWTSNEGYIGLYYSDDYGVTWSNSNGGNTIFVDSTAPNKVYAMEPTGYRRYSDDTLFCYYRNHNSGTVAYSYSEDDGMTWTSDQSSISYKAGGVRSQTERVDNDTYLIITNMDTSGADCVTRRLMGITSCNDGDNFANDDWYDVDWEISEGELRYSYPDIYQVNNTLIYAASYRVAGCSKTCPDGDDWRPGYSSDIRTGILAEYKDLEGLELTSAITIELWIKTDGLTSSEDVVIQKGTSTPEWGMKYLSNDSLAVYIREGGTTYYTYDENPSTDWSHYVLTYDSSTLYLYKNGELLDTNENTDGAMSTTEDEMTIANSYYGQSNYFAGYIDEVRISNNARNSTWVNVTYQNHIGNFVTQQEEEEAETPFSETASFTVSPNPSINNAITFTDTSTGSPTGWSWDFEDDSVEDSTEQNPTHQYTYPGNYTVNLTVTYLEGTAYSEDYVYIGYNVTVRSGEDYFVWTGNETTLDDIENDVECTIGIDTLYAFDGSDWVSTDETITSFEIIKTNEGSETTFRIYCNESLDYSTSRTDQSISSGYSYWGWSSTTGTTISAISSTKIDPAQTIPEWTSIWDSYSWKFWIPGMPGTDVSVSLYDVISLAMSDAGSTIDIP